MDKNSFVLPEHLQKYIESDNKLFEQEEKKKIEFRSFNASFY